MAKKTVIVSIISSIGASLCCISPVLTLLSGVSGIAAGFSWIEPMRPYLIGFSAILLAYAWYTKIRARAKDNCGCEMPVKQGFIQSTGFLAAVTLVSVLLMTFPLYSGIFYSRSKTLVSSNLPPAAVKEVTIVVTGMGCASCEPEVEAAVSKLPGINHVKASCTKKNTVVRFDTTQITEEEIRVAINTTGYTVER